MKPDAPRIPEVPTERDIELVAAAFAKGLEVELVSRGTSMWPLVRPGHRLLVRPHVAVSKGDLVAVRDRRGFVVHRVVRIGTEGVVRQGDNSARPDRAIASGEIVGVVVRQETRRGVILDHTRGWMRLLNRLVAETSRRTRVPWRAARALLRLQQRAARERAPAQG